MFHLVDMNNTGKTLYLIDGHALIFKMYYALLSHPMINSKGVDTSILYGFTKYLFELTAKEHPTHLAVAFDPPGGTFRHERYPEYKGTRSATPQLIIDALEPLCELCKALNIPVLMEPGYEADDVIGSMAKKAEKEGFTVYMVTPDKDYGQLISPNIFQYKPGKSGGDREIVGEKEICEKFGLKSPLQVIDILTICGDSSDNVPGVRGVGEVGAKKLLGEYGSVKGIYEHLDDLKPKQKAMFEAAKDHIELSRWLVTIKTDISLDKYSLDDMVVDGKYTEDARRLFDLYEFGSLKKYIASAPAYSATNKAAGPADGTAGATSYGSVDRTSVTKNGNPSCPADGLSAKTQIHANGGTSTKNAGSSGDGVSGATYYSTVDGHADGRTAYDEPQWKEIEYTLCSVQELIETAKKTGKCAITLPESYVGGKHLSYSKAAGDSKAAGLNGKPSHGSIRDKIFIASDGKAAEGTADEFRALIEDGSVAKTGYGMKDCWKALHSNGISLKGTLDDIEIMDYVINPEKSHDMFSLAKSLLGVDLQANTSGINGTYASSPTAPSLGSFVQASLFDDIDDDNDDDVQDAADTGEVSANSPTGSKSADSNNSDNNSKAEGNARLAEETAAGCRKAVAVELLGSRLRQMLTDSSQDKLYDDIEEPLISVLAKMEETGVRIDLNVLRRFAGKLTEEMNEYQQRVREMVGEPDLNIMSPKQIGTLIYEKLQLDPKVKAKKGNRYAYPTDEETLLKLEDKHPVIDEILEFRGLKKLLSTYIDPFPSYVSPVTGMIHTTFNQALTSTGRLSSSKPNLQNIPIRTERGKEIRKAFISRRPDGVILSADYSQIELRIMAHLSCDRHLIEAFRKGEDVHKATAAKIFGIGIDEVSPEQRRIAKTANFGIMYGISSFGLSQRLHISRADAKKLIDDYFASFPSIRAYIDDTLASVRETGYAETLFGRRRYISDINSKNGTVRALAERNAINAPIQGTAADIIKIAMANIDRRLEKEGFRSAMVLQIHDELLFDAYSEEIEDLKKCVVEEMENVIKLSIPLTVECKYGKNWLEAH